MNTHANRNEPFGSLRMSREVQPAGRTRGSIRPACNSRVCCSQTSMNLRAEDRSRILETGAGALWAPVADRTGMTLVEQYR